MTYTALDFETATASPSSICQIGLVQVKDATIVAEMDLLVQPPDNRYSFFNTRIHGIDAYQTSQVPRFNQVWHQVLPFIENQLVVAHNAAFDINVLRKTLHYYAIELPDFDYDCTYQLTKKGLKKACAYFDIDLGKHHDALFDARACANIYSIIQDGAYLETAHAEELQVISNRKVRPRKDYPSWISADPNNPFNEKRVVITGQMESYSREDLRSIFTELGARVTTSVSGVTNFLVKGHAFGPAKMQRVQELNEEGGQITILEEDDLLEYLRFLVS